MRLHTDFHDYYDNAVGYGIDDNVHYSRFTREVEIRIKSQFDFPRHRNAGLLGFCGKIYPFIEVKKFARKYNSEYASDDYKIAENYCAYSFDEYSHKESEWEDYMPNYYYNDYSREIKLKQFFIDWNYQSDEIFLEHKVPIWKLRI